MARKLSFSYYPWISQRLSDEPLKQAIARFVQLLNDALRSLPGNDLEIDAPVVMNAPDDARERIFEALVKVAAPNKPDSEGNAAVDSFWGTTQGFEKIPPDAYDVLFKSMTLLNLEQKDLMK